jgi:hypothetical protein
MKALVPPGCQGARIVAFVVQFYRYEKNETKVGFVVACYLQVPIITPLRKINSGTYLQHTDFMVPVPRIELGTF